MIIFKLIVIFILISFGNASTKYLNTNYHPQQIHQQYILEGPQDQQAKIGDRTILKCKFKNLKGEPQWCIDGFCLGTSKKESLNNTSDGNLFLKGRPRYRIIGDRAKGEFHLLVEPVQLQDNMYFYCMATGASESIKAVKSNKVFLTVLTHPQSLHLQSPVHVSLNKPSSIQCTARQSRPPVKILIAINGHMINDEARYKTEIMQIPMQQEQASTDNDDESLLMMNQNQISYVSSLSSINPEQMRRSYYDTITNVTIDDITMKMQGQTVECFAYSFVTDESYQSFNQNSKTKNHYHTVGNLNKISGPHHNNIMSTKSMIQVDYAPEVNLKIVSTKSVLKEEDVVSLVCETKATPAIQSYKWYIGNNYLNGVSDSKLNLKLRKEMHLKTVTCEASNTVASVKASLQLNILFNPAFVKGSKTYMLIDKNACNKPLTLDCQVSSNPGSNITWYRRRLNKNYINRINKYRDQKLNSYKSLNTNSYYSLFGGKTYGLNIENFNDLNNMYENEMIGSGPTYTIASFNCANVLNNLKNKTLKAIFKKSENLKMLQRFQREKSNEDSENDEYTNQDEYDYESEEVINENEETAQTHDLTNQNNDFGIYVCEATNKLNNKNQHNDLYLNDLKSYIARRYIKLNPNGAPIIGALPSITTSSLTSDQIMSLTTYPHFNQQLSVVELPVSIGDSVSLTCLIEPLPTIQQIVWLRENGKIIPNSRYYAESDSNKNYEINNKNEYAPLEDTTIGTSFTLPFTRLLKDKNSKYFKTKYESTDDEDNTIENNKNDLGIHNSNVISTTNYLVTSNGILPVGSDLPGGPMRSMLSIKNIRKQDFGIYKCKSTNSYGSRTAIILLREKTLMDSIHFDSYASFAFIFACLLLLFIAFFSIFMCLISRNFRQSCCCICCLSSCYSGNISKEKELIEKNLHCESHSDKTINEWLAASSKLSNDSGGNSSLANNTSTSGHTMATTIHNRGGITGVETHLIINPSSTSASSSVSSASTKNSTNSPRNELIANCSLLLHDDTDENPSDLDNHNMNSNTLSKFSTKQRDEIESRLLVGNNNTYQSSQFNKFLVSSPLISSKSKSQIKEVTEDIKNVIETRDHDTDPNKLCNSRSNTLTKNTDNKKSVMRSHNFTNGNFNAKISTSTNNSKTIVSTPLLSNENESNLRYVSNNGSNKLPQQFSNFTLNRHFELAKNQVINDKEYYENSVNNDDLNKIFQDTNFRLSDLFNELSPPNLTLNSTGNNSNSTYSTPLSSSNNYNPSSSSNSSNSSQIYNKINNITSSTTSPNHHTNIFPSFTHSNTPVHLNNHTTPTQPPPATPSRQMLLQTASQSNISSNLINKFPNPFIQQQQQQQLQQNQQGPLSTTSKFYNNFYRNQMKNSNEQCKHLNI